MGCEGQGGEVFNEKCDTFVDMPVDTGLATLGVTELDGVT